MKRRVGSRWFFYASLLTLGLLAPVGADSADIKESEGKSAPIVLEPFRATTLPLLSFGISLEVIKDNTTNKVRSMRVSGVSTGSVAEQKGLRPRMRIDLINGKPVEEFDASFIKGSELNKIFVGRGIGDTVMLDVAGLGAVGENSRIVLIEIPGNGAISPFFTTKVESK